VLKLIFALLIAVAAAHVVHGAEICEAKIENGNVSIARLVPQTQVVEKTVTRYVEEGGKKIPVTDLVTTTETEMIPMTIDRPLAAYRVSDINGREVSSEDLQKSLRAKTLVVFLVEELPPAKRKVFRPETLFFQPEENIFGD
jgi:hypothetical protein